MRRLIAPLLMAAALFGMPAAANAQAETAPLFQYQPDVRPHWASPENPTRWTAVDVLLKLIEVRGLGHWGQQGTIRTNRFQHT